jgi:L-asparaginase
MILANCEAHVGIEQGWTVLAGGGSALDAVEQAVRCAEADPRIRTVGRGGAPNLLGEMECDAAVMDGALRRAGAVAALRDHLHAVSVARAVMERTPHVLLVGDGAGRLATEIGAERAELLTAEALAEHRAWIETHIDEDERDAWPAVQLVRHAWRSGADLATGGQPPSIADTAIALAIDRAGHLAAASSSSGWARKYPGRVGDAAIIGAGLYADDRAGACACTHTGEMTIRCATASDVVAAMRRGATVEEACHQAMAGLTGLAGGALGPVMIHAIDRSGHPFSVGHGDLEGAERDTWMGSAAGSGPPAPATLHFLDVCLENNLD